MAEAGITADTPTPWYKQTDILIAIGVISIILMLIIPLPSILLDLLIAVDLMISIIIILTVMYVRKATDFSIFPSLLLITTVYRLALNVSSTRLILLKGAGFNVHIIKAFGDFVVGGNYVVGFIIFLILVAVQFLVITKGATRVSEVAARFTLDALPGKQMSIDADFNAGLITEEEANQKRLELKKEAEFYGAMDGASKFVQGDVKVGLVITVINIIGGLIVGTVMRGESVSSALKTYTLLTVGDGLVAQIPALLISTATGIIVTRSVSDGSLGEDLAAQLTTQPKAVFIASGFLFFIAFLPGFPTFPLIFLSIVTALIGYQILAIRKEEKEKLESSAAQKASEGKKEPSSMKNLLQVDSLEVEIGYNLIPLVVPEQGGDLLERITMIRRQTAIDMGLLVPPIRIRDNMKIPPDEYSVLIKGVDVAHGKIFVNKFMAMDQSGSAEKIDGTPTTEPAFGLPALWIEAKDREKAELSGYTVVDPPTIIATHLTEIIKTYGYELLGRQEIQNILDNIKEANPVLVEEVLKVANIGIIQKVLQNLLKERVSIRDMVTILETVSDYAGTVKNIDLLTEYVRVALKRQITHSYVDDNNKLKVFTIEPELENILANSINEDEEGYINGVSPEISAKLKSSAVELTSKISQNGNPVIFLTSLNVRALLYDLLEQVVPNLVVLSYNEIEPKVYVENLGTLSI